MINCIAIDDEPLALEVIKKYALKTPELNLVAVYSDPVAALNYLEKNHVSLLLLDIHMPDINGFFLYKKLAKKPMVIFTTAYKEYAVDGFEADAVDYLLKPFNLVRFQKAITKAIKWGKQQETDEIKTPSRYLYINEDYKLVKISLNDIIFMEALDDYVKVYTSSKQHLTLLSMKKMLEKLPGEDFIRIHRSYIVSKQKILFFQFRKVGLVNNIELPVGDTYRSTISRLEPIRKALL